MMDVHSGTAEIGCWLGELYWGKRLATRAAGMLAPYAFDGLCFICLQAPVFRDNAASMRVLEKKGFAREDVLRRLKIDSWVDESVEIL